MSFRNFWVSLSAITILVTYCVQAQETSVEIKDHCACQLNYEPVCGSDGKTYGNTCAFNCERGPDVVLVRKGECDKLIIPKQTKSCICPLIYEPVCGSDGKTYSNSCEIKCQENKGVVIVSDGDGECSKSKTSTELRKVSRPCACPKIFDPVCGSNGKTYANKCILFCARRSGVDVRIAKRGSCEE